MRLNAKINCVLYGTGVITNKKDNIFEVYFKKYALIKYYQLINGKLFMMLDDDYLSDKPTASFSSINTVEKEINYNDLHKTGRTLNLSRANSNSRSAQIARSLINSDLTKMEIFNTCGIDTIGKNINGYLSQTFGVMSDAGIIKYSRKSKKWGKGHMFDFFLCKTR